jgi:energy-coupling factor transport system ATP-binding protein
MLTMRGAGYRFPSAREPAVRGVELSVRPGEVVLLTGPTGCGKSTVLRLAAGLLARHGAGVITGEIRVAGRDPASLPPRERVTAVGFVAQNPGRQIVTGTLGDEVAFALESAGWSASRIADRVPEMLARVGLRPDPTRSTDALSGGERQRLVTAAALGAGARLLLLDEPLAHLDPQGAADLMRILRIVADSGVGVLLVEHRLEAALTVADRLVVMEDGEIVGGCAANFLDLPLLRRLGLRLPGMLDVEDRLRRRGRWPPSAHGERTAVASREPRARGAAVFRTEALTYSYPRAERPALDGLSVEIGAGERVAVLGANGSGKSTLLSCLVGALRSRAAWRWGRSVRVPQDPDLALFCESVREELEYGPREARRSRAEAASIAAEAAEALSVTALLDRAPQALSRGQRLRVAVAAALSCEPVALVLDEPTSGQDHDHVERMMEVLSRDPDRALLFATHDLDLALRHATRVIVLDAGSLVLDASPIEAIGRMPRELPLLIPPLASWCLAQGLPPMTAAQVEAALCPPGAS